MRKTYKGIDWYDVDIEDIPEICAHIRKNLGIGLSKSTKKKLAKRELRSRPSMFSEDNT